MVNYVKEKSANVTNSNDDYSKGMVRKTSKIDIKHHQHVDKDSIKKTKNVYLGILKEHTTPKYFKQSAKWPERKIDLVRAQYRTGYFAGNKEKAVKAGLTKEKIGRYWRGESRMLGGEAVLAWDVIKNKKIRKA